MTGKIISPIAIVFVFALVACGGAERGEVAETAASAAAEIEGAATADWVDQMAAVANAIESQPAAVDSILSANSMTAAQFDSLLYVIAADAELSARFEGLRTK